MIKNTKNSNTQKIYTKTVIAIKNSCNRDFCVNRSKRLITDS